MYPTSVKNLYIGKSGIDLQVQGQINGIRIKGAASLDPTTLVGEIFTPAPYEGPKSPDYYLLNGYWNDNKFLINPIGTELYTLWITGIPLGASAKEFIIPESIHHSTFQDSHRTYLFQVTKQSN